jgi:TRAP-type mannitol/chloroaromatic compound transport system substrate-binding protein
VAKTTSRPADRSKSRRKFLGAAAATATGAAALGFPSIVKAAAPISLRFQSTWPAKDIFHEYAVDFASKVNAMSGKELRIEVLPAGAVVKALFARRGQQGTSATACRLCGKNSAVALWGSGPAFGMDPNMVLAWHYYGGGKELLDDIYKRLNLDVVSFPYGPMPTQPFGWFKKPVTKVEDVKGLKFRTVGLAVTCKDLGAAVTAARRRDRAGDGPRPARCGRVQQRDLRQPAGFSGRVQGVHAAKLPPAQRAVRNPLQQEEIRCPGQ